MVRVDADFGGDIERRAGDLLGGFIALHQSARSRIGIVATGPDGDRTMLRLQNVAVAGDRERDRLVGHQHHRLEIPQVFVRPPVLGEFHGGPHELSRILLEFLLQPVEQRKCVRRRAGEPCDHLTLGETAHLARISLHDGLAETHLAVARHDHLAALPDCNDCRHLAPIDPVRGTLWRGSVPPPSGSM